MRNSMIKLLLMIFIFCNSLAQATNILHRSNEAEPASIDPPFAQGSAEMTILRDIFEGLVSEDVAANIVAGMATHWDISADGKIYTFHLRDANWSDGKELTAHDFVYSLRRAIAPQTGSKYRFMLYPIKNAKAISQGDLAVQELAVVALDAKTLQITLESSTPYFIGMLANSIAYPVPEHVIKIHGKLWTRPENIVSNGAFNLSEWLPQSYLKLKKSNNYWDKDNVAIAEVIYYISEDKNTELKRYRGGEIDFTNDVPNEQIKWIRENLNDEFKIHNQLGTYYFGFNLTKAPFKDNRALREALTLAIDRQLIVQHITASGENPAYGFVVPGVSNYRNYTPEYANWSRERRQLRAKELYAAAGYNSKNPLKVEILYNSNENNKKISIAIAAMWKEVLGVKTTLVNKEWKVYLNDRRNYNTQVFRGSWLGDYDDANTFLELFVSDSGSNTIGLHNEEYDALIAAAAQQIDMKKRAEILLQAEKILIDNYSLIPIYYYISKRLVKPYVSGYQPNIMNHWGSKFIKINK